MHLKLAPLQFLLHLVKVVDVPVLFCVLGEIDRKARVDHGACQLLGGQGIEAFLHEFVDDVAVGLRLGDDVLGLEVLPLLLKLIFLSLFLEIDGNMVNRLHSVALLVQLARLLG